jgi:hypothetical protein
MLFASEIIAVVAIATTAIMPTDSNHPMPDLHLIFFMLMILSFLQL